MKGHNLGTTRLKRYIGQGVGKGHGFPYCLWVQHSSKIPGVHQSGSSQNFPFFWSSQSVFTQTTLRLHHWSLAICSFQTFPPPQRLRTGTESSNPLPPLRGAFKRITASMWQKTPWLLLSLRKFCQFSSLRSTACGILVALPGTELSSSALEVWHPNHWIIKAKESLSFRPNIYFLL